MVDTSLDHQKLNYDQENCPMSDDESVIDKDDMMDILTCPKLMR